jgi:hypothetical protein
MPLASVGALLGGAGIVVAALFLVVGPDPGLGVQEIDSLTPRVFAYAWEANLYASSLAIAVPFGIELARQRRDTLALAIAAIIVVALPLGATRGAFIGLAAGLVAYGLVWLARGQRPVTLAAQGIGVVLVILIGSVASSVLLPNPVERYEAAIGSTDERPTPVPTAGGGEPEPSATATPAGSTPTPPPSLRPYPDTIGFRLERVPIALSDLGGSPLIGLGASSFGQRHADVSQGGEPDHLAIMAVAVLYESGVIGFVALGVAFAILAVALWRASRDRALSGSAAAFVGAITTTVVAFQATNALHFAGVWLMLGAATAVAAASRVR